MRPSIGRLRRRLTLEAASRTPDGGGGAAESWTAIAQAWVDIRSKSGDETVHADARSGHVSHEITLRYRSGVVPAMRFVSGTRRFDILAVIDIDERHRWLKCLCVERDL